MATYLKPFSLCRPRQKALGQCFKATITAAKWGHSQSQSCNAFRCPVCITVVSFRACIVRKPLRSTRLSCTQLCSKFLKRVCGTLPVQCCLQSWAVLLGSVLVAPHLAFHIVLVAAPPDSLFHAILPDNQHDAFQHGNSNFCKSIFEGLASVGYPMSRTTAVAAMLDVDAIMELLEGQLQGSHDVALHCPRSAPSRGIVSCSYHQWFQPYSKHRRYCQRPVSGRRLQCFLRFRLGCHAHCCCQRPLCRQAAC